jgi:hypothetical protein
MASTTRLHPVAQARLKELQLALKRDFGVKASGDDITSALVSEASVPQLVGMLIAFNKHAAANE